jgi:WD40 repeat protein
VKHGLLVSSLQISPTKIRVDWTTLAGTATNPGWRFPGFRLHGFSLLFGIRDGSRRVLWRHGSDFWSVTCSPDGRWIAVSGRVYYLILWDVRTGQQVANGKVEDRERSLIFNRKRIECGTKMLGCWDAGQMFKLKDHPSPNLGIPCTYGLFFLYDH